MVTSTSSGVQFVEHGAHGCVLHEQERADHFTREPRYGKEPTTGGYSITDTRWDSLVPDLVLHFVRNANHIQRLYDFYFPCTASKKSNPLGDTGETVRQKLDKYKELSGTEQPALVTPQLGISR
jgi:hypothetical protein